MAFPTGWNRRGPLVIQNGQVSGSGSHTDFPVLLTEDTLPSEIFDADGSFPAQNGGGDLRFTSDAAGTTQIPVEVVSFVTDNDPANGTAEIWVKVASVSTSADTTIYVWYNTAGTESQPAVTDTYGRNAVWSDYRAVFHLDEDPSGSAPQLLDSTGNGYNGTVAGTGWTSGDEVPAKIGNGIDFETASGQYATMSGAMVGTPTALTAQIWANLDNVTSDQRLFGAFDTAPADQTFLLWMDTGDGADGCAFTVTDGSTGYLAGVTVGGSSASTDQMYVGVWDGSNVKAYLDGSLKDTNASGPSSVNSSPTQGQIGTLWPSASGALDGVADEARYRESALSADWIATEYNNQDTPSTFVIEGTPVSPTGGRIMSSLVAAGGLIAKGGLAGIGGGLAR